MTVRYAVAIVDDDQAISQLLSEILGEAGHDVTGFDSPTRFLAEIGQHKDRFDCVLLDERMLPLNGLQTFEAMRRQDTMIPAIMVTGVATVRLTMQAIDAGFAYLLEKPINASELIHRVELCCAQYARDADEKNRRIHELAVLETLSDREAQVLKHLANGLLNKQIAVELGVGLRTVETYRNRVMSKIGAESFADAVAFAISVGLRQPGVSQKIG